MATAGIVSDLWRFPVKSFAGERLRRAFVGPFGLLGDRHHVVLTEDGETLTARRAHRMLGFAARCGERDTGERVEVTTPSGLTLPWDDPRVAAEVAAELGREAGLVRSGVAIHDAAHVHLLSTASLAAAEAWVEGEPVDRRRFRANVIVEAEGDEPFTEDGWIDRTIVLGERGPVLRVVSPTERCAITTFDPDTLDRDNRVLAGLARDRENLFGVYAQVVKAGWIEVGAPVAMATA